MNKFAKVFLNHSVFFSKKIGKSFIKNLPISKIKSIIKEENLSWTYNSLKV